MCELFLSLARYFAGPVARYPQYYPAYSPQTDFYRPNQVASFDQVNPQDGVESELEFFRSGYQPRFFGLKQTAINELITALRGPPGQDNELLTLMDLHLIISIAMF